MWVRTPVQLAIVDKDGPRLLDHAEIEQLKDEVAGWKQLERDALWRRVSDVPAEQLEVPPSFTRAPDADLRPRADGPGHS